MIFKTIINKDLGIIPPVNHIQFKLIRIWEEILEIENIGIITSPTGAVIQDIINRVTERYPKNILLFGVSVQGVEAPEQIVAGIKYFNNDAPIKPEIIIIARGFD